MNIKSNKLLLAVSLLTLLFIAGGSAFAQSTITETASFTGLTESSPNPTFTFAGFDTSLGTLTSVTIEMTNFDLGGTVGATNDNPPGGGNENIRLSASGFYMINDNFGTATTQLEVDTGSVTFTGVTPGSSVGTGAISASPLGPLTGSQAGAVTQAVDSSQFSNYEAPANPSVTLTLQAYSSIDANISSPSHGATAASESFSTLTDGELEIIYTYTPVPEPREMGALLMGFGVCLLFGRKFLRNRKPLAS